MKPPSKTSANTTIDIGIPIGIAAFRVSTQDYLDRIRRSAHSKPDEHNLDDSNQDATNRDDSNRDVFDLDDYIAMVRLWNTIDLGSLSNTDAIYRDYASAFFPAMVERATHALSALPTKGMALYSKQHDLYIGGKPHANSKFRLIAD